MNVSCEHCYREQEERLARMKKAFFPKQFGYLPRGSLGKYGLFQAVELVYDINSKPLEKNTLKKKIRHLVQEYLRSVEFAVFLFLRVCK